MKSDSTSPVRRVGDEPQAGSEVALRRMDIHRVLSLLPHRYPFLLIDRVIDFKCDEYLIALKNVTFNEP